MIAYRSDPRDLPWGWWMRVNGELVEDGSGGRWNSVREAFWRGRLGFPNRGAVEQQEFLLRVLSTIDAGLAAEREVRSDLFGGRSDFHVFHLAWLCAVGLVEQDDAGLRGPRLTPEGRSALLMLQATRNPAWVALPIAGLVDAIAAADKAEADDAREAALGAFEAEAARLPWVFARERAGRSHVVMLTGVDRRLRMPIRAVVWSFALPDERTRDDVFGWLAGRVERWEEWGEFAPERGAHELTQRLLAILVAVRRGEGDGGGRT